MRTSVFFVRLFSLLDALLIALALAYTWTPEFHRSFPDFFLALLVVPLWAFLFQFFGLYASNRLEGFGGLLRKILSTQVAGLLALGAALWAVGAGDRWRAALAFGALSTVAILLPKLAVYAALRRARGRGLNSHRVCVIGGWERAQAAARRFASNPGWGLQLTLVGVERAGERRFLRYPSGEPCPGQGLEDLLHTEVVDEVLFALLPEELPEEEPTIRLCQQYGTEARVLLLNRAGDLEPLVVESYGGTASLPVAGVRHDERAILAKRAIDLLGGALFLLLAAPLMLLVALLVKLSSPGPILFRQQRVGFHGRHFTLFKFRTMVEGAESLVHSLAHRNIAGGPVFKDREDWRITRIGSVLRRFSLDELPQLLNVLRGEMSLVGPRPLPVHESDAISGDHRRRFSMRPGITCLWQVNGRSDVSYASWMSYDLQYVDNWSIWLDTQLLLRTIPAVLSGRGAY
jgi:exopolysaccharide biosynthesis polyprenyl glycosylphosphotransferase